MFFFLWFAGFVLFYFSSLLFFLVAVVLFLLCINHDDSAKKRTIEVFNLKTHTTRSTRFQANPPANLTRGIVLYLMSQLTSGNVLYNESDTKLVHF